MELIHDENVVKVSFPHLEKYVDIAFIGCDSLEPENMFFPQDAVAVKTHWRTCSCFGSKSIKGKIHASATTIVER